MRGNRRGTTAHRIIAVVLVASALVAGATARADQIKANKRPRVSGPISQTASACGKQEAKHEGEVIARLQSCLKLYEFDYLMETDPVRNYGIGWVQTTVNPVNGWCATKVEASLILPESVIRHSSAPKRKIEPNKRSRTTVKVTSDADGYAVEDASVAQTFTLFPKSWQPEISNGGQTVGATWKGRESATLAFALGADISWPVTANPQIRGGLGNMSFAKSKGC